MYAKTVLQIGPAILSLQTQKEDAEGQGGRREHNIVMILADNMLSAFFL